MRPLVRISAALLFCTALSSAALAADPAADVLKPAAPAVDAAKPAAAPVAATPARVAQARTIRRRAAFRHHLARLHDRAPVRLAALDVLPPVRPLRLVDMPAPRDGVVVAANTIQIGRTAGQNSTCDSLLCSSYIIMGAGF